jgi:hypothetical protein
MPYIIALAGSEGVSFSVRWMRREKESGWSFGDGVTHPIAFASAHGCALGEAWITQDCLLGIKNRRPSKRLILGSLLPLFDGALPELVTVLPESACQVGSNPAIGVALQLTNSLAGNGRTVPK